MNLKRLSQLIQQHDYIQARIHQEVRGGMQLSPNVTVEIRRVTKRFRGQGPYRQCPQCGHKMRECEAHQLHQTVYVNGYPERYNHCPECGYIWKG